MAKGIYVGVGKELASLPVGSLIKDPNSTFLGEPIIWRIADKNHTGYPDGSITLITDKIIALRCFDAKEPNNSDANRQSGGNNRYLVSNIRQWLNSDSAAGEWYSAQHSADTPPNSSYVSKSNDIAINPYDTNAGFLNGFSDNFKKALLETNLVVVKPNPDGGGSETVTDKIFLASNTEVGLANENNIAEGTLLSIFSDDASRVAYVTPEGLEYSNWGSDPAENAGWYWWLRTPDSLYGKYVYMVGASGSRYNITAFASAYGVRPLCNLPSTVSVSSTTDEDGCYTLFDKGAGVARKVKKVYVGVDNKARKVKKGYIGVGGIARLFLAEDKQLAYYGYITNKLVSKSNTHGGSVGDYALFAEGSGTTSMVAYSSNLTQTTPATQSPNGRNGCSVVSVGTNKDYLLFAAGIIPVSYMSSRNAPVYDANLTRGTDITLQAYRDYGAGTSIAGYGLVGGGDSSNFTPSGYNTVEAIAPTLVTPTLLAEMTNSRTHLSATTTGNHALFCGGMYNSTAVNTIETYNSSLVKSTTLTMSEAKVLSLAAATKQYAVVLGGISVYSPQTVSYTVETISTSLVKGTLTNLEHGMYYGASTSLDEYAIFTGGYETTTSNKTKHNRVVAYGNNLVKKELTLGDVRTNHGAASTGNYAIFLGGNNASSITLTGEALQLIG